MNSKSVRPVPSPDVIPPRSAAAAPRPSGRLGRRGFFGAAGGLAALAGGAFGPLVARQARAAAGGATSGYGYGPLVPVGDDLALPRGFVYVVVSEEGQTMDDGFPVPKAMDGMCALPLPNGNIRLIRNHEDREDVRRLRPRAATSNSTNEGILNARLATHFGPRAHAYDAYGAGGTTSLEVNPRTRRLVGQHWSLVGTVQNCAGGVTPWGTWLSCEESTASSSATGYEKRHGYVFEVRSDTTPGRPTGSETVDGKPQPLLQLGRFHHEAVAVDPGTGAPGTWAIYLTEDDEETCGFYRFLPDPAQPRPTAAGQLAGIGGRLQMLAVTGAPGYDTSPPVEPIPGSGVAPQAPPGLGAALPATWVDVDDPQGDVFAQGRARGGARFRKLEGCWFSQGKVYMHASFGGQLALGQLWVYDVAAATLTLAFDSPGPDVLDGPDNLTVSPRGGIVMCEDGGGGKFLRGLSADGTQLFDFARNLRNTTELAGACFSPDGQTLFVNLYGRGDQRVVQPGSHQALRRPVEPERHERACTVAIFGPWGRGLL
jgi:hypothetical protein